MGASTSLRHNSFASRKRIHTKWKQLDLTNFFNIVKIWRVVVICKIVKIKRTGQAHKEVFYWANQARIKLNSRRPQQRDRARPIFSARHIAEDSTLTGNTIVQKGRKKYIMFRGTPLDICRSYC